MKRLRESKGWAAETKLKGLKNDELYDTGMQFFQNNNNYDYEKCLHELRRRRSSLAATLLKQLEEDSEKWRRESHIPRAVVSEGGHEFYRDRDIISGWVDLISRARESLVIATYSCAITNKCQVYLALKDAIMKRNVSVLLALDGRTNSRNRSRIGALTTLEESINGVFSVRFCKSNHSKFMVRDGEEVIIGSANLDRVVYRTTKSEHYKDVCVRFVDKQTAKELEDYAHGLRASESEEVNAIKPLRRHTKYRSER